MAEEADLDQLNFLHPKLRPYVKVLLTHEFGLLRDLPKIQGIQCGTIIRKDQISCGDRFQLRLLYCRKPLIWHVLLNGNDVTKAPDFIMEENFLADATPETIKNKVPSLANWCPTNVRCLLNVVLELLKLYKSYQVNLLRLNPSLQRYLFEYETFLAMAGINEDDFEVCVQLRNPVVVFLIHLDVDFSELPVPTPDSNRIAVLIVEFKDNAKTGLQLNLQREVEEAMNRGLELPDLSPDMSLMDYVPELQFMLQNKVEKVINHTRQRKMLYCYLIQFFEPSLINGDNINFTNVSFLLAVEGVFFVLSVHIPLNYPENGPTFHFLTFSKNSSQSEDNCVKNCEKMSNEEVAQRIVRSTTEFATNRLKKKNY